MNKNEQIKDFYTISEFAKKLQVHPNTVRRFIKNCKISAFKFGSDKKASYRIPHTEIERIIMFDLKKNIVRQMKENNEI
jgi:excisionase family DNA binding protein